MSRLNYPHVVALYEVCSSKDFFCLALDFFPLAVTSVSWFKTIQMENWRRITR